MDSTKYDESSFDFLTDEEKRLDPIVRPSISYWHDVWRRIKSNKMSYISMIIIIIIMLAAILIPILSPFKYNVNDLKNQDQGPSLLHWFGTDELGRDLFVRVFFGARYSILIGVLAAIVNLIIGVFYGSISGFAGGRVDNFMMRIVDILYSIPLTIYVIILMAFLNKPGSGGAGELGTIVLAFSISYWISMARIVRGEILQLKQQEFVLAARALGASSWRILIRHLIPNCLGSITVTTMLLVPQAIFLEAFLSFLGLGLSAPKASLGTLTSDALRSLSQRPYQMFFPALMICVIILSFNLFGDGLRDALDPKMKS